MKKILSFFISFSFFAFGFAQTFQATIQPLPSTGAGVTVLVKTQNSGGFTGKVSSFTITLAIPVSVGGTKPPISIDNTADPYISYDIYNAINQTFDGSEHWIYNILGTGDVTQAGAMRTWAMNADVPMVTINFNGNPALSAQIEMANLPDGGIDPNPNSYFGFSVDGVDRVNTAAMFYGIPLVSTATNDGLGYAGTSFAKTIPLVPLPVKFTSFNVLKKDKDALLNWSIENESALTDHYEVERSLNAIDFRKINVIARKNNGATSNSYDYTDLNLSAIRSAGLIYYRVKQTDKDGKFVYTEIKSVKVGSDGFNVSVYPNPIVSMGEVNINLSDAARINIVLIDAAGKEILAATLEGVKGLNVYNLNMGKLASGTYLVKVMAGNQAKTIPVIRKQ